MYLGNKGNYYLCIVFYIVKALNFVKESATASQIELEKQNGEPLILSGEIDPKAAAVLKILPELDFIKN